MSDLDNETTDNTELPQPSEKEQLETLKARAQMLGVSFHPSIGLDKLREKVREAIEAQGMPAALKEAPAQDTETKQEAAPSTPDAPTAAPAAPAADVPETLNQKRVRMKRDALKLVRLRITCMNPAKAEWDGEIISAGNSLVGTVKKYIPFNADEGWHVPHIIYQVLKDRQCQVFTAVRDARGNSVRKGKQIKEFALEVLPDLTQKELDEIARRQAMSKAID